MLRQDTQLTVKQYVWLVIIIIIISVIYITQIQMCAANAPCRLFHVVIYPTDIMHNFVFLCTY